MDRWTDTHRHRQTKSQTLLINLPTHRWFCVRRFNRGLRLSNLRLDYRAACTASAAAGVSNEWCVIAFINYTAYKWLIAYSRFCILWSCIFSAPRTVIIRSRRPIAGASRPTWSYTVRYTVARPETVSASRCSVNRLIFVY